MLGRGLQHWREGCNAGERVATLERGLQHWREGCSAEGRVAMLGRGLQCWREACHAGQRVATPDTAPLPAGPHDLHHRLLSPGWGCSGQGCPSTIPLPPPPPPPLPQPGGVRLRLRLREMQQVQQRAVVTRRHPAASSSPIPALPANFNFPGKRKVEFAKNFELNLKKPPDFSWWWRREGSRRSLQQRFTGWIETGNSKENKKNPW